MNETKTLCDTCAESIFCPTWAEVKCKALKKRIYGYKKMTKCKFYKQRPKNFKEARCQCEDCLKNDLLAGEVEE